MSETHSLTRRAHPITDLPQPISPRTTSPVVTASTRSACARRSGLGDQLDLVTMIQMNVAEAKAKLSELLEAAASGREVVIARSGVAVARLVPVAQPDERRLGFFPLEIDDSFFDALDEAELAAWE